MCNKYYRVDEKYCGTVEDFLEKNEIPFKKYSNPVKILLDEEVKKAAEFVFTSFVRKEDQKLFDDILEAMVNL